jgi:hypothetical protein
MLRRRRLRRPVLSRLTWAWLGAFGVFVALAAVFFRAATTGEGAERVALPVDQVETFARARDRDNARLASASPGAEERIVAPGLRDNAGGPDTADVATGDDDDDRLTLIYPDASDQFAQNEENYAGEFDYADGEVVIHIPGANRRAATQARAASLTLAGRPIPDPDPALLRTTALGQTPRIGADGRKPVQFYARPYEGQRSMPKVAIIVGGLGLNAAVTERAIDDLPPEVSLSFAPYAKNLEFWTKKARDAGHEVLIELPMEGYGGNDQALGAAALLSSRTPQENLQRLDWLMARFGGYFAATNYLGAKFSADAEALSPVLVKLKESGVGYIDDTGAAQRTGGDMGVPIATVSRMIPAAADDDDIRAVRRELAALEQIATRDGAAIGKTYAYAATIDEIVAWSRGLEQKGIAQAPASALLRTAAASR